VGTGAIFLKLYNGIVVGQQGEGFLREGKYYLKTNQNIMLRTSVHFCPLFSILQSGKTKNIRTDSAML
jgi:hypothetical protein